MKIFFDASVLEYPATGIGKSTLRLYETCLGELPSLEILGFHRRRLKNPIPSSVQTSQFGRAVPENLWRNILLPRTAKTHGVRLIHFPWSGHVPVLPRNVKVITTLHDVLPLSIPGYFRTTREEKRYRKRIQRDILRTHLLLTDSEYSKKEILKHFSVPVDPYVLSLASTIGPLDPKGAGLRKQDSNYFFYVGGYDRRKGLDVLLRVFARLHREKKMSHTLRIAGDKKFISTEFDRTLNEMKSLGVVTELGYISDQALADELMRATALIYPSKYEGFGLPPLEAMALGCPVITTRYTSLPEICGEAVYYVEPDDENNFAKGILDLVQNESLRRALSEKGLDQAAKFSWTKTAQRFLDRVSVIQR